MRVGLLVLDVFVPGSTSLKDKRRVMRSLIDRARQRLNVSVSEIDNQDKLGRGTVAFVAVATSDSGVDRILEDVRNLAESIVPGGISEVERDVIG